MISVIIVEDDPMVVEVNESFLQKADLFKLVGKALTGKAAIQMISELKPDLVLLDMYLPDISGLEVLIQLRAMKIQSDIIMVTAARDSATIHHIFQLGAVDYLVKPFRFQRFKAALDRYQQMLHVFKKTENLKQEDIDSWKLPATVNEELPKGLSEVTMKQIMLTLLEQKEAITAEELAQLLGMARVTVRRYLDYMEREGKLKVHMNYGTIGRPSHHYTLKM